MAQQDALATSHDLHGACVPRCRFFFNKNGIIGRWRLESYSGCFFFLRVWVFVHFRSFYDWLFESGHLMMNPFFLVGD